MLSRSPAERVVWKSETLALSERGGTNTQARRGGANGDKFVAHA